MDVGYIAYIDEAGDDHLKRIKPFYPNGASEWFVLSAAVIRVENEPRVGEWLGRCRQITNTMQKRDIHYRNLPDFKKGLVCAEAAKLNAQYFVVMSNKRNMVNQGNQRLPASRLWMYWWMSRLLLERVTAFCGAWSRKYDDRRRCVEVIFSKRDDLNYANFVNYLNKLWVQTDNNKLFLDYRIDWSVVDLSKIYAVPHATKAGLQLADVVASSFYQAVTASKGRCDPSFARILQPRIYRSGPRIGNGGFIEHGVKTMPHLAKMKLPEPQRELFKIYGYEGKW